MLVKMFEKQEKMRAKKEYQENASMISDLDDIGSTIDELVERLEESDFEFKDEFIKDLREWKLDIVAEMRHYENENLEIMEVWEEM